MKKCVLIILLLCSGCSFTMPVVGGKLQDEIDYESEYSNFLVERCEDITKEKF